MRFALFAALAACRASALEGGQAGEESTGTGSPPGGGALVYTGPSVLGDRQGTLILADGAGCGSFVVGPGDVDGDGVPDLGIGCDRSLELRSGASLADPPFAAISLPADAGRGATRIGDTDGDGLGEIGLAIPFLPEVPALQWGLVLPGAAARGDIDAVESGWTLVGEGDHNAGATASPAGDVDGDGIPDVAVVASNGAFPPTGYWEGARTRLVPGSALHGPGGTEIDAVYADIPNPIELGGAIAAVGVGDVDGDGRDDVAVALDPSLAGIGSYDGLAAWYLVSGASPPASLADAPRIVSSLTVPAAGATGGFVRTHLAPLGDLDGDGRAEIAVSFAVSPSAELAVVSGADVPATGDVDVGPFVLASDEAASVVACDLDGDGLPELVTDVGIWAGAELTTPGAAPVAPGIDGEATCLGDFDGDGTEDLATGVLGFIGST